MQTHVEKPPQHSHRPLAREAAYDLVGEAASPTRITDERPETIALRSLQALADGSPRVQRASSMRSQQSPVQRSAVAFASPAAVRHAALAGTGGAAGVLPFLTEIQRSFGRHDVAHVKAHTDGAARAGARAMGAAAFATGDRVAFASAAPTLRTVAHEAAHVVQQRGGVQLKGGVGERGDVYERHADEVAERVVAGGSAEALLDLHAGAGPASAPADPPVQRLNGAAPQNFRVTGTQTDDPTCTIVNQLEWDSSNNNLADLADFQSREEVTFATDPRIRMPAYAGHLGGGMTLVGNVLTKSVGVMSNPGGHDTHTGYGNGPKFTVGGLPNLQRAAWTLVGTQYYQTRQNGTLNWVNAAGPFTITRTMAVNAGAYSLSIAKLGPNCNALAGPTPIAIETSTAMQLAGAARGDQTADWNAAHAAFLSTANGKPLLTYYDIATEVRNNAQNVPISVAYEYTHPANPVHAFAANYITPPQWRTRIYEQARAAARGIITNVLTGANPPTRFIITIFRCAGVQQQALMTNENGGTYRVLLRADKLMDRGQWGADVLTSMAGRESQRANTKAGKKQHFAKAVATHELGHMLHASASPNMFLMSTLMPANIAQIQNANPVDPLAAEKVHICTVNGRVVAALNNKHYKQKWTYALNNPGEVVPEVFTAIMHGRTVPRGLAAVYVAYGGPRSVFIDAALATSFDGPIPAINEPEDSIAIINQP